MLESSHHPLEQLEGWKMVQTLETALIANHVWINLTRILNRFQR